MVLAPPLVAQKTTEGEAEAGAWDADVEGSPDVVAEYEPVDGGPDLKFDLFSLPDWGTAFFDGYFRDEDDQKYELVIEGGLWVRTKTDFIQFLHRFSADPLTNLEAVTNHGRVVWHDFLDPEVDHGISYSNLNQRTEIQPPSLSNWFFGFDYRRQERPTVGFLPLS